MASTRQGKELGSEGLSRREQEMLQLGLVLPQLCDRETTYLPDTWTPENPLWGQCAVVSLVAQDLFGGSILIASLEGTAYEPGTHYVNLLDRARFDFTADQFQEGYPEDLSYSEQARELILSSSNTLRRYILLRKRLSPYFARLAGSDPSLR